jgi:hypothetical protein
MPLVENGGDWEATSKTLKLQHHDPGSICPLFLARRNRKLKACIFSNELIFYEMVLALGKMLCFDALLILRSRFNATVSTQLSTIDKSEHFANVPFPETLCVKEQAQKML